MIRFAQIADPPLHIPSTSHDPHVTAATIFQQVPITGDQRASRFPRRSDKNAVYRICGGGGTPGRLADAISTEGGTSVNTTPGSSQKRWNQMLGLINSAIFSLATNMAISHAVIGKPRNRSVRISFHTLFTGSRKWSPFTIQITAQVSSRKPGIVGYRVLSHSSPTGEVRFVPALMITVPLNAPKIPE